MKINQLIVCPVCKQKLIKGKKYFICVKCHSSFQANEKFPNFIPFKLLTKETSTSRKSYEEIHKKNWDRINDGSYEILASFAKGNKTIDIACGDGFIEQLAPETVGVDFSRAALIKASKNGAKYLVQATAEYLPFPDNCFDVAICAGSLEHFANPQQTIFEMARVAKIQILTIHQFPEVPMAELFFSLTSILFNLKHQPIERPISKTQVRHLFQKAGLHIVFDGVWTLPVNYGRAIPFFPTFHAIPSCACIISIKND